MLIFRNGNFYHNDLIENWRNSFTALEISWRLLSRFCDGIMSWCWHPLNISISTRQKFHLVGVGPLKEWCLLVLNNLQKLCVFHSRQRHLQPLMYYPSECPNQGTFSLLHYIIYRVLQNQPLVKWRLTKVLEL